jgi:hypothetical protein
MKVLIACEESQIVCKAFRERGHEAYSNDIQDCSGGRPEWHLQMDALEALKFKNWDLLIGHPPCTYLAAPGMHYLKTRPGRREKLEEAYQFVLALWNSNIPKIALENPVGWLNTNWKKATQIIEPFYFGDDERKKTCLWLKGLPRLNGRLEVAENPKKFYPKPIGFTKVKKDGYRRGIFFCGKMQQKSWTKAAYLKSKTFPGIAKAMAEQWG